jgi:hypothetical protein
MQFPQDPDQKQPAMPDAIISKNTAVPKLSHSARVPSRMAAPRATPPTAMAGMTLRAGGNAVGICCGVEIG